MTTSRGTSPRPAVLALLVALAGAAAYANSLGGVFLFDDYPGIVDNADIRHLWPPWTTGRSAFRIVAAFSFALNHAADGLRVEGYHVVNLAAHLCAGLILFGLVRRTLLTPALAPRFGRASTWLALTVAALWTVHPLQTQAVSYISQRCEVLMGLFFLLTLYALLRSASGPRAWLLLSVGACAIGMGCKEVMPVCPLVAVLYDAVFVAGSLRGALRARWKLHVALFATIALPLALGPLVLPEHADVAHGFAPLGISRVDYLMTQAGVIAHYLRLAVLPAGLCFDYGWPAATGWGDVAGPLLLIGALAAATLFALWRAPRLGFLGVWFFMILAPTSSIVPVDDFAVEHRMYLPLAAIVVLAALAGHAALERLARHRPAAAARAAVALPLLLIATLAVGTFLRNTVYASSLGMWRDIAAKSPHNARAYAGLGATLMGDGEMDEAVLVLEEGLRRLPDLGDAVYRLDHGGIFTQAQRRAITLELQLHTNLGVLWWQKGDTARAEAHFRKALARYPDYAPAREHLENLLRETGAHAGAATGAP